MNRIKRIFLIRHAESEGNVDKTVHARMPDHAIPLSLVGHTQADMAGVALVKWLEMHYKHELRGDLSADSKDQIRLWNSPYVRTRQTADGIATHLGRRDVRSGPWLRDRAENILLCEQQFGLFDGIPDAELPTKFPVEHAYYKKCEDFEGRFWARMPMGESRFDVCQRVHQAFGSFQRDCERHDVQNIAIVAHGVTNRAFRMMWMHHSWEWFEAERNPGNCAINLIEWNGKRYTESCIFEGFKAQGAK